MSNRRSMFLKIPVRGACLQSRRHSSMSQDALSVWRMPWQQCSIFCSPSTAVRYADSRRPSKVELSDDPDDAAVTPGMPREHEMRIHGILRAKKLPRWNAQQYVKAIQNVAYMVNSGNSALLDPCIVKEAVKAIATHINDLNNYELTRVSFACAKGGLLERELVSQSFITLMEDEVMQRMSTLQALDLFRVLHSVTHINASARGYPIKDLYNPAFKERTPFDEGVARKMIYRNIEVIANLGAMDIANLVCLVAYNGVVDAKVTKGLNSAIKRRLWGIREPVNILTPVIALGMFGLLANDTVEHALKALRASSLPISYGTADYTHTGVAIGGNTEGVQQLTNECLYPLKLLEIMLRMDYKEIYDGLDAESREYLRKIRNIFPRLRRCSDWEYVPHARFQPDTTLLESENSLNLVPHIHGPYVMQACDPVRKTIVEANTDWSNHHTWQKFYVCNYHEMRKRHLIAAGYTFIKS